MVDLLKYPYTVPIFCLHLCPFSPGSPQTLYPLLKSSCVVPNRQTSLRLTLHNEPMMGMTPSNSCEIICAHFFFVFIRTIIKSYFNPSSSIFLLKPPPEHFLTPHFITATFSLDLHLFPTMPSGFSEMNFFFHKIVSFLICTIFSLC